MKHSATDLTPKEAREKKENEMKVKIKLWTNAERNRVFPEVDEGDEVKIFRKRKPNEKERVSNWSSKRYTVEKIEQKLGQHYTTILRALIERI